MAFEPPKKIIKGRAIIDFGRLKELWLDSGMQPKEFLYTYGLTTSSGHTRKIIKDWTDSLKQRHDVIPKADDKPKPKQPEPKPELKLKPSPEPKSDPVNDIVIKPKPVSHEDIWKTIKEWRIRQGQEDYQTAAALRQHIKIKLNQSLNKLKTGEIRSSLDTRDLDAISRSLMNVQRIQRLALGMSTENVGVPNTDQQALDTMVAEASDKDATPTFAVEVNKNGKFVRAKPRKLPEQKASNE